MNEMTCAVLIKNINIWCLNEIAKKLKILEGVKSLNIFSTFTQKHKIQNRN